MSSAVSPLRAVRLLTALRLTRLANQFSMVYNRRLGGTVSRRASPGKGRNRWVVSGVVALLMLFTYGNLTRQSIVNLRFALDPPGSAESGAISDALMRGLSMEMTLLLLVVILVSLGTRELAQPDWDLEWLVTLPVRMPTLLWSRLLERSVANPVGVLTLLPAGTILAWGGGLRWSAVLVGAIGVFPLLLLGALARTLVDTGLRLRLAAAKLRNLQAVLSIASLLLLYSVMSLGLRSPLAFILGWARDFPAWACWLPPGLVVRALGPTSLPQHLGFGGLLLLESAVLLALGVWVLERQLRGGVVAAGSRDTARRRVAAPSAVAPSAPAPTLPPAPVPEGSVPWLRSPVQRRELRLLSRDRNFLVQTLVLPVIIVVSQIVIQGRAHSWSIGAMSDTTIASVAFGIAAYTLMLSAFQTLNSEGGSLWLLYTVPQPIDQILAEKARLWAALALIYPSILFIAAFAARGAADWSLIGLACIVLLGVPIYTGIAVALGVFGCDPLAVDARTKVRPTYLYLFTMLAGIYTYAILASEWWQRLVLITLSAMLAIALWQKARDELPYLLDPAASPPARVSTSDGIICAMMFFVFQGIVGFFMMDRQHHLSGGGLIIAYASAGAVSFLLVRLTYLRSKTTGVPRILAPGLPRALAWGAGAGLVAAAGGLLYLTSLQRLGILQDASAQSARGLSGSLWIPLLAVVAAPLCEEFIFRGLIFGGLRRTFAAAPSILASAALFAIVHPPLSMLPVFGLGVCTAFVYDRTRMLAAPMLAHAVYNGIVVLYQWQR
jgi:membrane protease YdiL (CAAX protease family)